MNDANKMTESIRYRTSIGAGYHGDERCPERMNYLDWLMMICPADEYTESNVKDIVHYLKQARASAESGVKPKKADYSPRVDRLAVKPNPKLMRRAL